MGQHVPPGLTQNECEQIKAAVLKVNEGVVQAAKNADVEGMFQALDNFNDGIIIRDGQLILSKEEAGPTMKPHLKTCRVWNTGSIISMSLFYPVMQPC